MINVDISTEVVIILGHWLNHFKITDSIDVYYFLTNFGG